jgi:hypothetical protein
MFTLHVQDDFHGSSFFILTPMQCCDGSRTGCQRMQGQPTIILKLIVIIPLSDKISVLEYGFKQIEKIDSNDKCKWEEYNS